MTGAGLAQRMVFLAAAVLVAGVLAALAVYWVTGSERPAEPTATVNTVRHLTDGSWAVDVEVTNDGDGAAVDVEVIAELALPDGDTQTGMQTIDLLAPAEVADLVFTFTEQPTEDALTVRVASHSLP